MKLDVVRVGGPANSVLSLTVKSVSQTISKTSNGSLSADELSVVKGFSDLDVSDILVDAGLSSSLVVPQSVGSDGRVSIVNWVLPSNGELLAVS